MFLFPHLNLPQKRLAAGFSTLAFLTLLFGLWTIPQLQRPYLGYVFDQTGRVLEVTPNSPASAIGLLVGDIITHVDGMPVREALPHDRSKAAGESVKLVFSRGTRIYEENLHLAYPPTEILLRRVTNFVIALAFWLLGVMVFFRQWGRGVAQSFLLLCLNSAAILWVLPLSSIGVAGMGRIMFALNFLDGANFLYFHTLFPQSVASQVWRKVARNIYVIAIALSLIILMLKPSQLNSLESLVGRGASVSALVQGFFLATVLAGLSLLLASYRDGLGEVRRRVRLIVFGTILGIAPLCLFYVAEIRGSVGLPYDLAILGLLLIPAAYTISVRQTDLMGVDSRLYQFLIPVIAVILLVAGYLGFLTLLSLLSPRAAQAPLTEAIAGLCIAFSLEPTRHVVQRSLYRLFYGPVYDYIEVLSQGTGALAKALNENTLAKVLTELVPAAMKVSACELWLSDEEGKLRKIAGQLTSNIDEMAMPKSLLQDPNAGEAVQSFRPQVSSPIQPVRWWVPLVVAGELQGIWVIGPKFRDESFSPVDMELIKGAARHFAFAAQAVRLLEIVRQDLALAAQAREEEREHLSHELHDEVIQSLNGFKLFLQVARHQAPDGLDQRLKELQEQIRGIIEQTRSICHGLRPSALQELGLIGALETLTRNIEQSGMVVTYKIPSDLKVGDATEVALYRIAQEALNNIRKHARAQRVELCLSTQENSVTLSVQDDGIGFDEAAQKKGKQLGLSGMRDRAAALGGTLRVRPSPSGGTTVEAHFPTPPEQNETMMGQVTENTFGVPASSMIG